MAACSGRCRSSRCSRTGSGDVAAERSDRIGPGTVREVLQSSIGAGRTASRFHLPYKAALSQDKAEHDQAIMLQGSDNPARKTAEARQDDELETKWMRNGMATACRMITTRRQSWGKRGCPGTMRSGLGDRSPGHEKTSRSARDRHLDEPIDQQGGYAADDQAAWDQHHVVLPGRQTDFETITPITGRKNVGVRSPHAD